MIYLGLELCFDIKYKMQLSIFCGMIMACIDELHQLYSLNRGPKIADVVLDTFGVISGVFVASFIIRIFKKLANRISKGEFR